MTTTLYAPAPYTKISALGYDITQAGTAVPDGLVSAIISQVYAADGIMLTTSAGGTTIVRAPSYYNSGTGAPTTGTYLAGDESRDSTGAEFVCTAGGTPGTWVALGSGTLPAPGSYTYDASGNPLTDPDGNTYTWNSDGTPHTQTKGGVTRTFTWNSDGTLASVA